jgi:hypothetical protein
MVQATVGESMSDVPETVAEDYIINMERLTYGMWGGDLIHWLVNNTPHFQIGRWFTDEDGTERIPVTFQSAEDALLFKLRWV